MPQTPSPEVIGLLSALAVLMLGALIALAAPTMSPRTQRLVMRLLSALGLLALGVLLFMSNPFLFPYLALPVLVAGLIVAFVGLVEFCLTGPPSQAATLVALLVGVAVFLWRKLKRR